VKLFELRGRIAVITGSSRGIGRAIAEAYAAGGAAVLFASKASAYVTRQAIVVDGGATIRGGM
jgi:NADP-dependent 3-hydroxy acid dehydrogenase YdfG